MRSYVDFPRNSPIVFLMTSRAFVKEAGSSFESGYISAQCAVLCIINGFDDSLISCNIPRLCHGSMRPFGKITFVKVKLNPP